MEIPDLQVRMLGGFSIRLGGKEINDSDNRSRKVWLLMAYMIYCRNRSISQEELADLTEANTTRYNAAANSVNMETVRDRAMNEMGMVYASQGTVIEYDRPAGDYVKQYSDIPESGVLAKSGSFTR